MTFNKPHQIKHRNYECTNPAFTSLKVLQSVFVVIHKVI